jgi:hypothetical protein
MSCKPVPMFGFESAMSKGRIKGGGALAKRPLQTSLMQSDDKGEDDRSLTTPDTKTDRSSGRCLAQPILPPLRRAVIEALLQKQLYERCPRRRMRLRITQK